MRNVKSNPTFPGGLMWGERAAGPALFITGSESGFFWNRPSPRSGGVCEAKGGTEKTVGPAGRERLDPVGKSSASPPVSFAKLERIFGSGSTDRSLRVCPDFPRFAGGHSGRMPAFGRLATAAGNGAGLADSSEHDLCRTGPEMGTIPWISGFANPHFGEKSPPEAWAPYPVFPSKEYEAILGGVDRNAWWNP